MAAREIAITPRTGTLPALALRLHDLVVTTDHKKLGLMYIGAGLVFFIVAGLMASMMRLQLAAPNNGVVSPQVFNRLFTMHGTTMVFLVGMPIIAGMMNYLVPLMIGARDMAFPRLNAFGFWMFFFGGLLLYFSYLGAPGIAGAGSAPDVGWFAYSPLTARAFSRGHSTDYWILGILLSGVGSVVSAINVIATAVSLRCKGMTMMRLPLFVWLSIVTSFMILLAMASLSAAQIMLLLDRFLGARFFDTQAGGSAVLWQHFFWIFGHPEVYILIIPAFACLSEIIPVFSRKPIFGYPIMVAATTMIAFISLGVWAHHMFTIGMTSVGNIFFATSTFLVSRADRDQDLQLAGHDVRRQATVRAADAFLYRISLPVFDRRPDRSDAGCSPIRLAVARFLFRRGSFPLHARRRVSLRRSSPGSITGIRRRLAGCSIGDSGSGISGCSPSDSTLRSTRNTSPASSACRAAFTPMKRAGAGRSIT